MMTNILINVIILISHYSWLHKIALTCIPNSQSSILFLYYTLHRLVLIFDYIEIFWQIALFVTSLVLTRSLLVCVVRSGVSLRIPERESTGFWEVSEPLSSSFGPFKRWLPPLPLQISISFQVEIWVPLPPWLTQALQPVSLPLKVISAPISQQVLQWRASTQKPQSLTHVQSPQAHRQPCKSRSQLLPGSVWPELVHHRERSEGSLL